ncbi:NADP-dependent oxidoreductase domain-containing protein [Schizophyllum amplum]|uniref:NADP-dependent oxidoreductase domain-containing protein n=1 Tax=Schizophyllum amplum TaxID=97359 RepID=A0A550CEX0_9AGAR|nr:NADP-dependent oxidoreductase domain-containing protein [Auriculariopsis ampla]
MSDTQRPVEYRQLGKSGLRISVPVKWVLEADEALPILKAAWDRGINTIDTAKRVLGGRVGRDCGRFVREYNIPREEIIIATKCYNLVGKRAQDNLWRAPPRRFARLREPTRPVSRAIFNAVDASLRRLGTTYIDLLQIHRETMRALHDLVRAGKVRYIGASSMRCWQFAMMNEVTERHGWTKFVSMQSEYSLLYREEEREMYPYCRYHGIGLIPWSPLAGGLLARPHDNKRHAMELPVTKEDKEIIARVALAGLGREQPIAGLNSLNEEEMVFLEEL